MKRCTDGSTVETAFMTHHSRQVAAATAAAAAYWLIVFLKKKKEKKLVAKPYSETLLLAVLFAS